MPKHSYRWATYRIEVTRGDGRVWDKTWKRQVMTDPQIDTFKSDCQAIFLAANPGYTLTHNGVRSTFNDGFNSEPLMAKLI